MSKEPVKCSIIIPFYQNTPGILRETVQSIYAQRTKCKVEVVITDDASPVPAKEELDCLHCPDNIVTKIIRQPNSGPGAARNTSLKNVNEESTYIALMDSDDRWEPDFLDTAIRTLDLGYDLFFADSSRHGHNQSRFRWDTRPEFNICTSNHTAIDPAFNTFLFEEDFFNFLIKRSSILGTSNIAYRRSVAPKLRFREQFFNGQDRIFKLELAKHVKKVAFSTEVMTTEGKGINIFDSSSWGTPNSVRLLTNYIAMSKYIIRNIEMTETQRRYVAGQLTAARQSFAANIIHMVSRGIKPNIKAVLKNARQDPASFLYIPRIIAKKVFTRAS